MKKRFVFLAIIAVVCAACVMLACGEGGGKKNCMIAFKDYDGKTLQSGAVGAGFLPEYKQDVPARPSDDDFEYVFIGWEPEITAATKDAVYTAQYFSIKLNDLQDGTGSENDPHVILTARQLRLFKDRLNSGEHYDGEYFVLDADIDLGGEEWTPIGMSTANANLDYSFGGDFDGQGHKISNFKITDLIMQNPDASAAAVGLFGCNRGTIKNLGAENFVINISDNINVDSVSAGGLAGVNLGTISGCYATGDVSVKTISVYAGGLVGGNSGIIADCYAFGDVCAETETDFPILSETLAGGLAGTSYYANISGCYAAGNVSAISEIARVGSDSTAHAGGLIGLRYYGTVTDCYAAGDVSAISKAIYSDSCSVAYAGGLIGSNTNGETANCYASGDVSATAETFDRVDADARVGGLIGEQYNHAEEEYPYIKNCYALGNVSAVSSDMTHIGGLIGFLNGATSDLKDERKIIFNCYRYEGQVFYRESLPLILETPSNGYGLVCTQDDLDDAGFYSIALGWNTLRWDFADLSLAEGNRPLLRYDNG